MPPNVFKSFDKHNENPKNLENTDPWNILTHLREAAPVLPRAHWVTFLVIGT